MTRSTDSPKTGLEFLIGGGEMGERMRALDWAKTPLGAAAGWPQSLRTIVRVMLDSRYAMWMLWGPEFTFFCNDAYLPTVGIKRDWVLGARADKVWDEIWSDIGPRIECVLAEGRATWDEALLLFLERSGFPEETYHTFSYSPVYDDGSRIAGMLCVVTEVTERVISERRLRVLRDLAQWPRAETTEEACERLVGTLALDPLDVPFASLYMLDPVDGCLRLTQHHGALPDRLRPARIALAAASQPWPMDEVLLRGTPQAVDLSNFSDAIVSPLWPDPLGSAMLLPVQHGSATSVAVLVAGVSPRRPLDDAYRGFFDLVARQFGAAIADVQAYEAERRRAEALAEIDRAKTVFFSNVSHEFRTPLTLILGPIAEIATDPATPAPIRAQAELAHRNSVRLLKLVNSLLDFSRFEAGRAQASFEPIDLAALTRDLASSFRSAIIQAGLIYNVECEPLPELVYADRDMWEQVVLNLISNAFKFTFEGTISVRVHGGRGGAVLEVSDTGVGVPAKEIPRLFDRFHRVEGTVGRTHEGSGIGLALVQEIVKLHGAAVEAESEPGRGTTFRVEMPFGMAHLPADRIKATGTQSASAARVESFVQEALRWQPDSMARTPSALSTLEPPSPGFNQRFASTFGARIVLADDNADMREYIRQLLSPDYRVETAADGEQALAAVRRERPELILSDVMMPRSDGFELLKALRDDEQLRDLPVILLSARAGEESRIEGLDRGADDYLVKPFTARELQARVGSLIELTRIRATSEQRLRLALEQLQAADRQKDEFLAMLAHELRNPLAPIYSASELLARTLPAQPQAQAAIATIKRQATQLTRLVDDLLDVSRITKGRVDLKHSIVDLSSVIAQALETVEPLIREKRHHVIITAGHRPLYVSGDFVRLVQCVSNLLTNAAKYTDAGGRIHVETRQEDDLAVIGIIDTGAGMSPELLPRVFDLFVQSERTLDRSQGGLGIGLSVVKRLIEMHGGRVGVKSAGIGCGSTFEISLPVVEPPATSAREVAPAKGSRKRIFIVDDNADAAETLAMLLQLEGHEVRAVHSPADALRQIESFKPDVALVDIGLPELDGYELVRRLRNQPSLASVKFVAVTGYGQVEDRRRVRDAGFNDHLVKPVSLPALERTLGATEAQGPEVIMSPHE